MSHNQTPTMTGAAQTMSAWSKVPEARSAIPVIYQNTFDQYFSPEDDFPHVILTPALDKFPHQATEKLICDTGEMIHIFERQADHVIPTSYYYRDISFTELGIILLNSWLTLTGKTNQGESATSTIEFNTTSLRYFANLLKKLRPAITGTQEMLDIERDKFNYLSPINFKFMNYGRESLIAGETVLQILLQPELREPSWTLFGHTFYKTVALAHLLVLTDHELILIHEAQRKTEFRKFEYGGTWQYIPLQYIASIQVSKSPNERLQLSIQAQPNQRIESLFEAAYATELEQLCIQFQELVKSATFNSQL